MEPIIEPVAKEKILAELTQDKFIRKTSFGGCEIYNLNYHNSPNVMQEIGRLREITFRNAGGGTGKSVDIDDYDTHPDYAYEQLVVWDPNEQKLLGGYRYMVCSKACDAQGNYHLATTGLFNFSEKFQKEYLPFVLELGRSFVYHDDKVENGGRKGLFVLDNLWEGLGAIVAMNPHVKYLFGKVTMYLHYDKLGRDYILYYMKKHFGDKEGLLQTKNSLPFHHSEEELAKVFSDNTLDGDYKILFKKVRELNHNIPPLISSYIGLSSTMKSFGTSLNSTFGDVEETGILITVSEIIKDKYDRYIDSYAKIM